MAVNEDIRGGGASGEGDPALARAYGAAPREEPPARLDAAILAAARREAGARPRPLWALRAWRVPVGIAAVVVLSVSLVTLVREEGGHELYQPVRPADPAPQLPQDAAKSPAPAGPAAEPAAPRLAPGRAPETPDSGRSAPSPGARGTAGGRAPETRSRPHPQPFQEDPGERPAAPPPDESARAGAAAADRSPPPAAVMDRSPGAVTSTPAPEAPPGAAAEARRPMPPAAKAAPPRAMRSERDVSAREDASRAASGAAAAAPESEAKQLSEEMLSRQQTLGAQASRPRVAAILKELDAQPPEKWLERIHALRREGQTAEAREVLAEFKRRYPGHAPPAELQ